MKLSKLALIAAIACGVNTMNLDTVSANEISLVSCCETTCDCGEPVCGCEPVCCDDTCCEPECGCESTCCEPSCCEDPCCDSGCDSACGLSMGSCLTGDCCIGDPISLFGDVGHGINVGGWASIGYHSAALPLFNSYDGNLQLHQAWLYAEKAIDTSCGFDYGGRIDYIYGTDGPDTQAFGIENGHWDTDWDNGNHYGSAIPQLYGEVGYGDVSVKFGHFYTLIGYEVVGAPDNFFYSHAYTMYNSEPFTHTGVVATVNASDDLTLYGGYTMGWDSGFEDNGDNFLGGFSVSLTDTTDVTYMTTFGRFGESTTDFPANLGPGRERGYMHSIVSSTSLSDNLTWIAQSDMLRTDDADGNKYRSTIGLNNYLLYTVNDCLSYGMRLEYWSVDAGSRGFYGNNVPAANIAAVEGEHVDVFALTAGINYKPHSNVVIRPEIRYDWYGESDDNNLAEIAGAPGLEDYDSDQFTFGFDTIFLF